MPLFALFLFLLMFEYGIRKHSLAFLIAALALAHFLVRAVGWYWMGEGMADIPLTFFAFGAFYCLLQARGRLAPGQVSRWLFCGAIFASGAASVKQAGLYILASYPLLVYLMVARLQTNRHWGALCKYVVLSFFLCLYSVFQEFQVLTGNQPSEIRYVTQGIFKGMPILSRVANAMVMLIPQLRWRLPVAIAGLMVVVTVLLDRQYRWMVIVLYPYALIWVSYFSYDGRNGYMVVPFICLGLGLAIERWVRFGDIGSADGWDQKIP
jgi:hypothetical protein